MPERRNLPSINIKPREMPFDQIISVKGRNPVGESLPMFGKVLSDAMVQRANLIKMGQQTAAIERAMGAAPGSLNGMDAEQGLEFAKMQNELQKEAMKRQQQELPPIYITPNSNGGFSNAFTGEQIRAQDPTRKYQLFQDQSAQNERISGNLEVRKLQRLDKNTQALSKRIEDLGVPEALTQFETLNRLIPKEGAIPGFGMVEGSVPSFLLSPEGRSIRQSVAALQNVKIKDRSGAAVTPPEFVRLREEFGTGKLKTEQQLRQGIDQALMAYRERTRNALAGFDNETRSEYLNRENVVDPLAVLSSYSFGGLQMNNKTQPSENQEQSSVPAVGGTFNGQKVVGVRRVR